MTPRGPTVIGLGNTYARDDGVGPAVAAALAAVAPEGVVIVELDGEPARLVEAWADTPLTIVVDAARSGATPGTVIRLEGGDLTDGCILATSEHRSSSHALGVVEALGLGQAMARLPARLVVFAVEGQDFSPGPGLSDVVRGAVPTVVSAIVSELATPSDARRPGSLPRPGAGRR